MSLVPAVAVADKALAELQRRSTLRIYQDDPVAWAHDILGFHAWSKQKEVLRSVAQNRRTAVRSANGTGKTKIASIAASWYIAVNDPTDTVVAVTAPSFGQLQKGMFHEFGVNMAAARERGNPLPGKLLTGGRNLSWIYDNGFEKYTMAYGVRPPDRDAVTSFQGTHRGKVLVVLEEAGAVPRELYTAAERITTNKNASILAIGNPDRLGTPFHQMFDEDSYWHKIHISAYDTPAFTGEEFPEEFAGHLIQPDWVEENMRLWGENDARTKISILGDFPDEDGSVLFPLNLIRSAMGREIPGAGKGRLELGFDVAGAGADESVVYSFQGGKLELVDSWGQLSAPKSIERIHKIATDLKADVLKMDAGGLGGPIHEVLQIKDRNYDLIGLDGSKPAKDPRRHLNRRAEWYDNLRTLMVNEEITFAEDDVNLPREMQMINFMISNRNSIQIENKRDLKKRVGKSPDYLDAAVYACVDADEFLNPEKSAPAGTFYQDLDDIMDDEPGYLSLLNGW